MTFPSADGLWKSIAGVEQDIAEQLLKLSFDAGINFVDTANFTNGESEKTLARAIKNLGIPRTKISRG
jgi:aryl-alcohol dehydrogenase-like predicted oxidoreductase